jgi:ATP-binding cassette subfamily F protein 3
MSQIVASGVAVEFGATTVFQDLDVTVGRGDRWGIVGRNGAGKTTLFRVLTGDLDPARGVVTHNGAPRFTHLDQHRAFPDGATVWEAAASPFDHLVRLEASLAEQAQALASGKDPSDEALARYDRDLERFQREGGYEMEARVDAVLAGLGFDPTQARAQPVAQLSGGEAGRVGLARQLVAPADVYLLDEPTNHLDLDTTRWLEDHLRELDATALIISHDRAFLEAVVDHVLHFEGGTAHAYTGDYADFVEQRRERRLARERAFAQQQKTIARDQEFIRRNIAGQKTNQAKARRKKLARLPRLSPPPSAEDVMSVRLEPAERGGNQVLVAEGVTLKVGRGAATPNGDGGAGEGGARESRTLVEDFSAILHRGDVVGLVGANGSGKSTFLEAVAGVRAVDGGTLRLGASIDVAYYRQDMEQVPEGKSLFDIVSDLRPSWDRGHIQGHLGRFGFPGESAQRRAETLSGGERARVALAMLMLTRANFILLDEPTNHLDVESVEALEDALEGFEGSVLLVSHDRQLLRNRVTRVWALEDGRITDFPGDFAEWEEKKEREAEAEAARQAAEEAERKEKEQRATRARMDRQKRGRKETRALRRAAESAEAEVHRLEREAERLETALADPDLYEDGTRMEEAVALKKELADVKAELERAMESWMEAEEALT